MEPLMVVQKTGTEGVEAGTEKYNEVAAHSQDQAQTGESTVAAMQIQSGVGAEAQNEAAWKTAVDAADLCR